MSSFCASPVLSYLGDSRLIVIQHNTGSQDCQPTNEIIYILTILTVNCLGDNDSQIALQYIVSFNFSIVGQ